MLDMGFIEDIDYIISKVPKDRQTMLFSATIPPEIRKLGERHMYDPEVVSVSEDEIVLPNTKQMYFAVGRKNKIWALCRVLDKEKPKAIVFAQTKHMVDIIERRLTSYGLPCRCHPWRSHPVPPARGYYPISVPARSGYLSLPMWLLGD